MINATKLGEKITEMFNFIYEINADYYLMGRDYFELCTQTKIAIYKRFKESLTQGDESQIINQYKRVRKYTQDIQAYDKKRIDELIAFIEKLSEKNLDALNKQVEQAIEYSYIAYKK